MVALLALPVSACAANSQPPCRWRVLRERALATGEVAFTERERLLREPENANRVPGPDSLWFLVKKNAQHKPAIFLEDHRTGQSDMLIDRASGPRVSPDGKYLACIVWHSVKRPWNLTLLDLKTRKTIEPLLDGCASPYAWSPDGKWLAVMVTPCQSPQSRLALVAVPSGRVRWIDSLSVFADYEFGWSPDSRNLAVIRPTTVDRESEEPTATELWIFSNAGRSKCRLAASPGFIDRSPRWITNSTVLIDRTRGARGGTTSQEQMVLELSEGARP